MSGQRRIAGVFAHPDDESFLAGGTLARAAARGDHVTVIACTGGEAGESWDPGVDPARIAQARRQELREACAQLGVGDIRILGYRDSGIPARGEPGSLCAVPLAQVARDLAAVLADLHPDVVITHDRTGGYGHPDHIRASEATAQAVRALDPVPPLYEAVFPRSLVDAFQDAFRSAGLRAGRAAATGADMDRDAGVPDALVSARLDVSAHVQAKRAALRAHRTQLTGHVLFRLPWPVLARLWSVEHFARAGAPAGGPLTDDLV